MRSCARPLTARLGKGSCSRAIRREFALSVSGDQFAISAIGTKRTCRVALHMSAFGGKADMPFALHMSAFDPKRTSGPS